MIEKILVAIDGSDHADKALDTAVELAEKLGAELTLLHVVNRQPMMLDVDGIIEEKAKQTYYKVAQEVGEKCLDDRAQRIAGRSVGPAKKTVVQGDPAESIVKVANKEGANLIVMGTRSMSGIQGLMMGSVAHKVSILASCPVMTVK